MKISGFLKYAFTSIMLMTGCRWFTKPSAPELTFSNMCLSPLPSQPRNQGQSESCWGYSMVARLENILMQKGDSVRLSPWFITRKAYEEALVRAWQKKSGKLSIRGMGHTFLSLAERHGIVPEQQYECRPKAKLKEMHAALVDLLKLHRKDVDGGRIFFCNANNILDQYMGITPSTVRLDSISLSPQAYYHQLTADMPEVKCLTSFLFAPFYSNITLDYPDNYERQPFLNLPLDSLCQVAEETVKKGGTLVWEGDTSNNGYYWREGLAVWHGHSVSPEAREANYRRGRLHDNHTLLLIGWAIDNEGCPYFIAQNSWGTNNKYHGLLYMSLDYFKMWTVALFL